jgi:hypothetical protein
MNNPKDVRVGQAVIPYCPNLKCWLLPSGKKQVDRKVYNREIALLFCHRISQLIGGLK